MVGMIAANGPERVTKRIDTDISESAILASTEKAIVIAFAPSPQNSVSANKPSISAIELVVFSNKLRFPNQTKMIVITVVPSPEKLL